MLNHLDWRLHEAGYRFARYADDFVVVCQSEREAQEARQLVQHVLKADLGLSLSPEKTKITTFGKGHEFLGFYLSSRSRRMRDKSVQKFKAKVRELTVRKHNLDRQAIEKLNRVIRGTANYFARDFSICRWMFQKLDSWIRMRLRCMKWKRKNYNDNQKFRGRFFRRKLGLLTLEEFCQYRDQHGQARGVIPRRGATSIGVAQRETLMLVNVGNRPHRDNGEGVAGLPQPLPYPLCTPWVGDLPPRVRCATLGCGVQSLRVWNVRPPFPHFAA